MTSERECAPVGRLVRWVLLGLVAAGVIGMHVLSEPDTGSGHGMMMYTTPNHPVAVARSAATGIDPHLPGMVMTSTAAASEVSFAPATAAEITTPAPGEMSGAMGMCLLFLAAGAAAIVLTLLAFRARRSAVDLTVRFSGRWAVSRRGPPLIAVPPHSLCILRV